MLSISFPNSYFHSIWERLRIEQFWIFEAIENLIESNPIRPISNLTQNRKYPYRKCLIIELDLCVASKLFIGNCNIQFEELAIDAKPSMVKTFKFYVNLITVADIYLPLRLMIKWKLFMMRKFVANIEHSLAHLHRCMQMSEILKLYLCTAVIEFYFYFFKVCHGEQS